MATTTNYSWTTPDDTDLVKDGASAIRTLGSSADTTVKNLNPGTTAGDIDYYTSSTAKARVAIGTVGQVLAVNAGATAPEWIAAPGGGKVLQVVQATYSTVTTVTSLTMTDTGLSASITPSSATSKVLVLVSQPIWIDRITSNAAMNLRLMRDATRIYGSPDTGGGGGDSLLGQAGSSTRIQLRSNYTITYLDSPATTSATTYKTQFNVQDTADSGSVTAQGSSQVGSIILLEIGA